METTAKNTPKLDVADDCEALAQEALRIFVSQANKTISEKDTFCTAISGGKTPARFFQLLGQAEQSKKLPWEKVHLFWVDERYVEPDSQQSNYRLARETFLDSVPVPQENIHRIPTEHDDIDMSAKQYEQVIRDVFSLTSPDEVPRFDLILLGMGADGHTGSLFPDSYASFNTENLVCAVYGMGERLSRITLTRKVLHAAESLVVMVCGREKAHTIKQVLSAEPDEIKYPIHILWPVLEKVTWLLDRAAAGEIQP